MSEGTTARTRTLLVIVGLLGAALAGCATSPPDGGTDGPVGPNASPAPLWPRPGEPLRISDVPQADGARLMELVERQVYTDASTQEPRYRTPGSPGHAAAAEELAAMLEEAGLTVERQVFEAELPKLGEVEMVNLYGVREGREAAGEIWLAAHWDSRAWADAHREPCTGPPVLGANDGAAGVAVVLHAAELMAETNHTIRVALFDGEDQGCPTSDVDSGYGGSSWAVGSTYAARVQEEQGTLDRVRALVLVDMPGDASLLIRREGFSAEQAPRLTNLAFRVADVLDAQRFENVSGPAITDDHRAFLDRGVPAVDLIHLDRDRQRGPFPATHHTENDTVEHLSEASMAEVTRVVVGTVLSMDRAG